MREEANLPTAALLSPDSLHTSNGRGLGHQGLCVPPASGVTTQSWLLVASSPSPILLPSVLPSSLGPQMQETALRENSDPREPESSVETTTVKQRLYFIFKRI